MELKLFFYSLLLSSVAAEDILVTTKKGILKGYEATSTRDGTPYYGFVGIPYAQPPVGSLRLKAPLEHPGWDGVRDATVVGAPCYGSKKDSAFSEDCLFLNLFTPSLPNNSTTKLKPLMIFVHGGGFHDGSGDPAVSAPDFYMDHDVLFGALNYRLGPLGFMSLQIEDCPGNAGLKDVVMALRWVKENIEYFGGDPERIVLFGQSAGAAVVSFVQLSPTSKGLINGIIHESGETISSWAFTPSEETVGRAYRLAKLGGCDSDDTSEAGRNEMLNCLLELPAGNISYHSKDVVTDTHYRQFNLREFTPTAELDLPGAFLTRPPMDVLTSGDFNQIPTMLGANLREGLVYLGTFNSKDPNGDKYGQNMTYLIPLDLQPDLTEETEAIVGQMIRDFYMDGKNITLETRQNVIDVVTDKNFVTAIELTALLMSRNMDGPIYNYHFIYDGPFTEFRLDPSHENITGPGHHDELGYLMNPVVLRPVYAQYDRDSTPHRTIDRLVTMWTNFAKYWDPTPEVDDTIITAKWKPFTSTEHNYLEINTTLTAKIGLATEHMKFWNDVYDLVQERRPFPE